MNHLVKSVLLLALLPLTTQQAVETGACECAVLSSQMSDSIMEQAPPYNATCNEEGEEKCQQLCIALAESVKENAPQIICEHLAGNVTNLEVAMYSRVCNATNWKFTGLKSAGVICCQERKYTPCDDLVLPAER